MATVAALLMVLGGFTKHIVIALPLASAAWLAIYRRHLLFPWISTGILACAAAVLALTWGYGARFVDNVTVPRVFSLFALCRNLGWGAYKAIVQLAAFSTAAAIIVRHRRRDEAMTFAGLAIATALLSILTLGSAERVGLNVNMDLFIATSIAFGLLWDRAQLLFGLRADFARMLVTGALIIRLLFGISFPTPSTIAGLRNDSADMVMLRDWLTYVPDPILCDILLACIWAGHHNAFISSSFGRPDTSLDRLSNGEFAAVVVFGYYVPRQDRKGEALTRSYGPPIHFGQAATAFSSRKLDAPWPQFLHLRQRGRQEHR